MGKWGFEVEPISGALGAEVRGVDLANLDEETFAELRRAWRDHLVLFFREQVLSIEQQVAFARRFGPLHVHPYVVPLDGHPEVIEVVKEPADRGIFGGTWHSDLTYLEKPMMGAVLHALEVPAAGGDTLFANMYLAYESLSGELKRLLRGLRAVHSDRNSGYYKRERVASMGLLDSADTEHMILIPPATEPAPPPMNMSAG